MDYLIAIACERMFATVVPYILLFMSLGIAISSYGSVLRAPPQLGFLNILLFVCWAVCYPHACNREVSLLEKIKKINEGLPSGLSTSALPRDWGNEGPTSGLSTSALLGTGVTRAQPRG